MGWRCLAIVAMLLVCAARPCSAAAPSSSPRLVLQTGHDGPVSAAAWSPDGRHVLTGGGDLAILVWSAATGHLLSRDIMPFDRTRVPNRNSEQDFFISRIIVSPDGKRFASTIDFDYAQQHETVVWDMATRAILADVPRAALFWSADSKQLLTLSSATRDEQEGDRRPVTFAWLTVNGGALAPPIAEQAHPDLVSRSPDGRWIITACSMGGCALKVMDANGRPPPGPQPAIKSLPDIAWTKDSVAWLLDNTRTVHVYPPGAPERLLPLPPADHATFERRISVNADGSRFTFAPFASASDNDAVTFTYHLGDGRNGAAMGTTGSPFPMLGETISFDGSAAESGPRARFRVASPDQHLTFEAKGQTLSLVPAGDGGPALPLGQPATIRILDAAVSDGGQLIAFLEKVAASERRSANPDDDFTVRLAVWDAEQGRFLPDRSFDQGYEHLRWLGPDRLAVLGYRDDPTVIVDVRSGAIVDKMPVRDVYPIDGDHYLGSDSAVRGSWVGISSSFTIYDAAKKQEVRSFGESKADAGGMRAFAVSPDGGTVAQQGLGYGDGGARWGRLLLWDSGTGALKATLVDKVTVGETLTFSPDGRQLLAAQGNRMVAWDMETNTQLRTLSVHPNTILHVAVSPAGLVADVGSGESGIMLRTLDGGSLPSLNVPAIDIAALGFVRSKPILWAAGSNGVIRFWSSIDRRELFTFYAFGDDRFIAAAPDGRYETNLPAETSAIGWVMPDTPDTILAPQTFMRDYFEPRLATRLIDCALPTTDCPTFKPLPPLDSLDRLRPNVAIEALALTDHGTARISVSVREQSDRAAANGRTHSGAYDLRLFRDGHLVAQWPAASALRDLPAWRKASRIIRPGSARLFSQTIEVPVQSRGQAVTFSAYAFNDDRVKGDSAVATLPLGTQRPRPRRLFVIAIGIDAYRERAWRLQFAASDAQALATALGTVSDYRIVPITLLADAGHQQADKAIIRALLALLAGHEAERATLIAAGVDVSGIDRATPDDAVLISFSGHGDADASRNFFLVPADGRRGSDGAPDPRSLISSDELTDWLRDLDAGELALIIDACHSAASVDTGDFKPAPIGDPGLGQLAFDKGIRILAASQGDGVAMESATLRHGLLTYALVEDGLAKGLADRNGNGRITLDELLRYAELRLPELSRPREARPTMLAARTLIFDGETMPRRNVQKPQLFDFTDSVSPVIVRTSAAGR